MIKLVYDIEPVAQSRPRFASKDRYGRPLKRVRAIDSDKSRYFKNFIKVKTKLQYEGEPLEGAVKITVTFYRPIQKSISRKRFDKIVAGEIKPTVKPDLDNYFKAITDAINGIVFKDDNQIVEVHMFKEYGEEPHIELEVEEL